MGRNNGSVVGGASATRDRFHIRQRYAIYNNKRWREGGRGELNKVLDAEEGILTEHVKGSSGLLL